MNEIVKPFDTYRVHYGTTNPEGRDVTRIEFFYGEIKVGQIWSDGRVAGTIQFSIPPAQEITLVCPDCGSQPQVMSSRLALVRRDRRWTRGKGDRR